MSGQDDAHLAELKKKRTFRKFSYRGVDLDQLLDMDRYNSFPVYFCADSMAIDCMILRYK